MLNIQYIFPRLLLLCCAISFEQVFFQAYEIIADGNGSVVYDMPINYVSYNLVYKKSCNF